MMSDARKTSSLDDTDLYAGIAGIEMPVDEYELGHGLVLRRTYAHVFAPYLAAFARAERGKPHPPPWKAVSGGLAYDITTELLVPKVLALPEWFDHLNTVWWVVALLRLEATTLATVPIITNVPFSEIAKMQGEPPFWPVEMHPTRLVPDRERATRMQEKTLSWIREHCFSGGGLMRGNDDFNVAFQAFDGSIWAGSTALGLLTLWGALERLFSPAKAELCFRIPAAIATFLHPPGINRFKSYKQIKQLYDVRSSAAHGRDDDSHEGYVRTYELLRSCLHTMLAENRVPSRVELEERMFGVEGR